MTKQEEGFKLLPYLRPIANWVPEIEKPQRIVPLKDKVIWTLLALLVFLVSSQIPLFGIQKIISDDPMYWSRMIMASNRGTLMELGINPVVTAGMVMQLLMGAKLLYVDNSSREDKHLSSVAQKIVALVIALFQAVGYVFSGMYGEPEELGAIRVLLIVLQLVLAAAMVALLDEALNAGYGMVSGISLFIATNVCEEVLWKALSPLFESGEYEGVLVAFMHFIVAGPDRLGAIKKVLYRDTAPNLIGLLATILVFLVVSFFQGFQVNVAIHNKGQRGHSEAYGIKLFYTSNMPIILQSTLLSNLFFVSRLLHNRFPSSLPVQILGKWRQSGIGNQALPVAGLTYYLSPPSSVLALAGDPIRGITYVLFILVSCAVFSRTWIEVSGSGPSDILKSLKDQNVTAYGGTDKLLEKRLKRYIPIAASLGGACIGILSLMADFLGAIGSGTGILLTCGIIYDFYESYKKELKAGQTLF